MRRRTTYKLHVEALLLTLIPESRNALIQTVQTVASDPALGKRLGIEAEGAIRYYVDVRLDRYLARIYYAATNEEVDVRDIDFYYLSPQ